MYFLEARNINKIFGNNIALDNVSFNVGEGRIYGLLGPNGAGKTTMLRIINHIIKQDSGELLWQNIPMTSSNVDKIGYLPEERGLYKKMKVGEHGLYLAKLRGLTHKTAMEKLLFWFEKFDVLNWWNRYIQELSKGMQQKVQFIYAVLHEPKLYVFDEPFSGFDPINAELVKKEILEFKKNGASVILSTHNMASVEELCDEILLINKAKLILQGNVYKIKQQFKENIFEVHFSDCTVDLHNILEPEYELVKSENLNTINKVQIKIPTSKTQNDLLNIMLSHCRMHSFFEVLPTLKDIFIQQVISANFNTNNYVQQ